MRAEAEGFALFGHDGTLGKIKIEELRNHGKRFGAGHDLHFGIFFRQSLNVGGMIRLQMGDDEIIRRFAFQNAGKVFHPGFGGTLVHGV